MVDFHTHILPGIDDGSQSVKESIEMLDISCAQGVDIVVATPHFDADISSVDDFLDRRKKAFDDLISNYSGDVKIFTGAEVSYYQGIEHLENISSLCIENTNLLLLEMPMTKWSRSTVESVVSLSLRGDLNVIIAHIERYFSLQSIDVWNTLLNNGVIFQSNTSFFLNRTTFHKAKKLLLNGFIHLIGTDCHNTVSRKPDLNDAFIKITKKIGVDYAKKLNYFSNNLINNKIF